jgi:hypothetical protein
MTATFPSGVKQFPVINPGDPILSSTENAQQEEIVAIETEYRRMGLQNLADPGADRVLFWDDSAGALKWLQVDGIVDTAFGQWQDWTPTQTGWTALPTGVYRYCKIGKLVMGIIYMSAGTSNSTVAQLSLPFTSANNGSSMRGTTGYVIDNGLTQTQPGTWAIFDNATVINLYKTFPEGSWTASGTKRIITVFFYEAA